METGCEARESGVLPIGGRCRRITMSTGNVISMAGTWRRRAGQSADAELVSALDHMLDIYKPSEDDKWLGGNTEAVMMGVPCSCYSVSLGGEDRQPLNITLKVFAADITPDELRHAIQTALSELSVGRVEAIVLSLLAESDPDRQPHHNHQQQHQHNHHQQQQQQQAPEHNRRLLPLWRVLETLYKEGLVQHLGVSDLSQPLFESMFSDDQVHVRPSLIQINLNTCCSVPEELRQFCREQSVQILTHNDTADMLPEAVLSSVLQGRVSLPDQQSWRLRWFLRYLVMIQHTGVIKNKGYIVTIAR